MKRRIFIALLLVLALSFSLIALGGCNNKTKAIITLAISKIPIMKPTKNRFPFIRV